MEDNWLFGLRGIGILLAALMGGVIVVKMRQWHDPALIWLLMGLSIGPIIVLSWNIAYRIWLQDYVPPVDRVSVGPLVNVQVRFLYAILNKVLDGACILAVAIGIAKLYRRAERRPQLLPARKATTNDPRN